MNEGASFQDGEQVLLIDQRGKRHLIFLRKSETFHSDRGWIAHDAVIGQPEGTWVRSSMGLRYIALRPTRHESSERAAERKSCFGRGDSAAKPRQRGRRPLRS